MSNDESIIRLEIKTSKNIADQFLINLNNKGLTFRMLSSEVIENKILTCLEFYNIKKNNIDSYLKTIDTSLDSLKSASEDEIDLRIYIPKNAKDESKNNYVLPGGFKLCPLKKKKNDRDKKTIFLETGWAFGSGSHPSTIATISEIVKLSSLNDFTKFTALDIGTGSGILSIILAKLGIKNIIALDIDKEAIKQATTNIKVNNLVNNIKLVHGSIEKLDISKYKSFNLVVANLTPSVLLHILPYVVDIISKNGYIIITSPVKELSISYFVKKFKKLSEANIDNWYAFTYKKL